MRWPFLLAALVMCACAQTEQEPTGAADADAEADGWDPTPNDAEPELRDTAAVTPECLALTDAGPSYETGSPAQAWCDITTANPTACPTVKPMPGDACPSEGLACRYDTTIAAAPYVAVASCRKGAWYVEGHHCASDCVAWDGGSAPIAAACGSAPAIPCATNDAYTDYERASHLLRELGQCCGGMNENMLRARFEDGCVKSLEVRRSDSLTPTFLECMGRLLAGRRLTCAKTTCAEADWTTLK